MLSKAGFKAYHQTNEPTDIAIINTCGFIGDAKEESINTILEFCQAKKDGKLKELYVMGCLSERYREDLQSEIPEVDRFYGKFDWTSLVNDLQPAAASSESPSSPGVSSAQNAASAPKAPSAQEGEASASPARTTVAEAEAEANPADSRQITTPRHYAYIKISEGCNRFCAFCAIPLITGRHHSRPIEEIEQEVSELVAEGVKEFNIIAQDLSSYGLDLYGKHELAQLIDRLADIKGVERIRLHYAYPADFPMDILDVMARRKNVCKYLDIALQHISDRVLTNMRRHITGDETRQLLAEIRKRVPGIHIRTTLMVGFPGEEEQDFEELMEFVKEQRFERMGAFAYCEEEGTYGANNFEDNIPEDVKQERLNKLMALQEEISLDIQQSKQGKILDVIIDSEEDEYYIGRTEFDSPEVDPEVMVKKTVKLKPGDIIPVKIEQALPFELIGSPA
jgi:ribosomal protein S12 methylthiotransferase